MAGTFYAMARVLGYDVHQMTGQVPYINGGFGPHSWLEITSKSNGKMYVCDPDFQNNSGVNGYMFNYGSPGTWQYVKYKRMN